MHGVAKAIFEPYIEPDRSTKLLPTGENWRYSVSFDEISTIKVPVYQKPFDVHRDIRISDIVTANEFT